MNIIVILQNIVKPYVDDGTSAGIRHIWYISQQDPIHLQTKVCPAELLVPGEKQRTVQLVGGWKNPLNNMKLSWDY